MSLLDKLFSKEITRRTGAHAINIYIENEQKRKRSRARGKKAIASTNIAKNNKTKTTVTTKKLQGSFLQRLDTRFPWLKLIAVCIIGFVAILDLCDLTISHIDDTNNHIKIAPMSKHVRVTERILKGKKLIAFTFDDGPSNITTPKLLDILRDKDVPATFFMLGNMARNNPEIVKRAKKEGHIIASHTMYHQNLIRISAGAVQEDINETNAVFQNLIGQVPNLTRPPYGNINDNVRKFTGTPLILWSVDTLDWKNKNVDSILATTMSEIHDGAIILMHDIYSTSIDAVPVLIDTLRKNGYEFVTIPELAEIRGVNLTAGTIYYNFRP